MENAELFDTPLERLIGRRTVAVVLRMVMAQGQEMVKRTDKVTYVRNGWSIDEIGVSKLFRYYGTHPPQVPDKETSATIKKHLDSKSSTFMFEYPDPSFHLYASSKMKVVSCPFFEGVKSKCLEMLILSSPDKEMWNKIRELSLPNLTTLQIYGTYDEPAQEVHIGLLILCVEKYKSQDLSLIKCKSLRVDTISGLTLPDTVENLNVDTFSKNDVKRVPPSIRYLHVDQGLNFVIPLDDFPELELVVHMNIEYRSSKKSSMSLLGWLKYYDVAETKYQLLTKREKTKLKATIKRLKKKMENLRIEIDTLEEEYESDDHPILRKRAIEQAKKGLY